MQPLILVTTDRRTPQGFHDSPRVRPKRPEAWVLEIYVEAVRQAGGIPVLLPPGPVALEQVVPRVDGIVLTGGDMDIHPSHYGATVEGRLDRVEPMRTELELELGRYCLAHDVPVLGICGGMQILAVAAGGTLIQDLPAPTQTEIFHEQPNDPAEPSHRVALSGKGIQWFRTNPVWVNSTHHQAVDQPGPLLVVGRAPDAVIEVVHHPEHRFAVGAQWHPELLGQLDLYRALISACGGSPPRTATSQTDHARGPK